MKWGPNGELRFLLKHRTLLTLCSGAKLFYEPQSYSNPRYVSDVMQRQAELELQMAASGSTFFACGRSRSSSDAHTESGSYASSHASPSASMCIHPDDCLDRTAADIQAAMSSPLLCFGALSDDRSSHSSKSSSSSSSYGKVIKAARSLTELDTLASSMRLSKDESIMDVDDEDNRSLQSSQSAVRALSCGAKRPLMAGAAEEDKRRKVDEAMVVAEAVDSGVIMPTTAWAQNPHHSVSARISATSRMDRLQYSDLL